MPAVARKLKRDDLIARKLPTTKLYGDWLKDKLGKELVKVMLIEFV
jgi:hypothetical protein